MLRFLLVLLLSLTVGVTQAQLLINEVMQSNIDCLLDDLNEYPDSWIELYNAGDTPVNLAQYRISDDSIYAEAWPLPSQSVAPHGHITVLADKEAQGLHTPFRLETGKGCTAFLFDSQGQIVDRLYIAQKQPAPNIAYGRRTDGGDEWGYLYLPTPDKTNCGRLCTTMLGEPIFSEPGRVLTSSQLLTLTLSLPDDAPAGTEIRYTMDGSEPTASSQRYTNPISISNTRVIRAKLFRDGCLSPRSTTQSYLYLGRAMTIPVISISTDNAHFYDDKRGIYVNGTYSHSRKNYEYDWRRPINIEYFEEAGAPSLLNQLCETRIQGGASRGAQFKSLALYAHKRFGEKHFKYEFFPDQRPGQDRYKSLILRNAGNDFDYLYMRDAIMQRNMAEHTDLDWQAWRPAIIYINGTYKGMLNIRERSNASNIYTNYDGLEDIDMVENWNELKEGTMDNFNAFTAFYNEHGHSWDEYAEWMDLDEYLNLMIMNLYYCNLDFPGNNFMMWRPREEGGRWRFIAKDTDFGMGLYGRSSNYETIKWIFNPNHDSSVSWANRSQDTRLFRRLMEDERFLNAFIDRSALYMGTFLNYDGTWATWEPMYNLIKTEYPNHRRLINQWWPNYNDELNSAKNWLRSRTSSFYTQLGRYFGVGQAVPLVINESLSDEDRAAITVWFGDYQLPNARFNGRYFPNREVTLQGGPALDADGQPCSTRTVSGWTVVCNGRTTLYDGPQCQFTIPATGSLVVSAHVSEYNGIEQIMADKPEPASHQYYDLMGRRVARPEGLVIEVSR